MSACCPAFDLSERIRRVFTWQWIVDSAVSRRFANGCSLEYRYGEDVNFQDVEVFSILLCCHTTTQRARLWMASTTTPRALVDELGSDRRSGTDGCGGGSGSDDDSHLSDLEH